MPASLRIHRDGRVSTARIAVLRLTYHAAAHWAAAGSISVPADWLAKALPDLGPDEEIEVQLTERKDEDG